MTHKLAGDGGYYWLNLAISPFKFRVILSAVQRHLFRPRVRQLDE
jgi:hypothetical protein